MRTVFSRSTQALGRRLRFEARLPTAYDETCCAEQERTETASRTGRSRLRRCPSAGEAYLFLREVAHLLEAKGPGNEIRERPDLGGEVHGERGDDPGTSRRVAPHRPDAHEKRDLEQPVNGTPEALAIETPTARLDHRGIARPDRVDEKRLTYRLPAEADGPPGSVRRAGWTTCSPRIRSADGSNASRFRRGKHSERGARSSRATSAGRGPRPSCGRRRHRE